MKITDLLSVGAIDLNAHVTTKEEAIERLVDLMMASGKISDKTAYKAAILAREAKSTTGVGEGIAIPHGQDDSVIAPGLAVLVVPEGIDFNSLDGQPARLFFMIAAPTNGGAIHLETLAHLSGMLMNADFKESLINAQNVASFMALIDEQENKVDDVPTKSASYDVLAVTACPTGIAHTFMAAESLSKKAQELNISFKVETNGATGPKNILTEAEIKKAKGIIVAADKQVEMSRFDGCRVIITKVADGINHPESLLQQAVSGQAEIYHHQGESVSKRSSHQSIGRTLYTQLTDGLSKIIPILMGAGVIASIAVLVPYYQLFNISDISQSSILTNGFVLGNTIQGLVCALFAGFIAQAVAAQSGFATGFGCGIVMQIQTIYSEGNNNPGLLGGIIAGFLGGYTVLLLQKLCQKLPEQLDGIKATVIYPVFALIIGAVVTYFISGSVGLINSTISNVIGGLSIWLKLGLGLIIGAMMAVDMGGPINKLAYIFGISQIIAGNYEVMAAVMAAGMVPPLAIALATTFFRSKFNDEQRKLGKRNYLMGLSFISEGTLPFMQVDPGLVRIACIIAAAISGALTMIYNCGIRIPHGGIFVLPLMEHPFRFLVALLAGSICGAAIYGFNKENGEE